MPTANPWMWARSAVPKCVAAFTFKCAEAVGQILSIDSESSDRRVMVALVDCGGFVLPSPIDVADPALIGRRVEFTVSELEVWRA